MPGYYHKKWLRIPRSLLPPGYFRAKMGIYPSALLPPRKNIHTLSCKSSTFPQCHFNSRKMYKKTHIPLQSGNAGILTLCIRIIHSYLRASSPSLPHGTNASLIIGSEQMPPCHERARNVCLQKYRLYTIASLKYVLPKVLSKALHCFFKKLLESILSTLCFNISPKCRIFSSVICD